MAPMTAHGISVPGEMVRAKKEKEKIDLKNN